MDRDAAAGKRGPHGADRARSTSTSTSTEGEHIRTEISCKFTEGSLEREYAGAGLELLDVYTDPERLFALSLAGPCDG